MRGLYTDIRELPVAVLRSRKAISLGRFQEGGHCLLDASGNPKLPPDLIARVQQVVQPGVPVILIISIVYATC